MDPIQPPPSTGDLYKDLQTTFAQARFTRDEEAWRVAKALRRCRDAAKVKEAASYYRNQLVAWLEYHMADQNVEAALRAYTSPPPDQLLARLRDLLHGLDIANSVSGKKIEEDKGSGHIGTEGYEGSQISQVDQKIFTAAIALQDFLEQHQSHFQKVKINGATILGYLKAVLADQNVNTCNNEVASTIDLALDQQFALVPAHIEVGLRLLAVGFFDSENADSHAAQEPSMKELQVMAEALAEAVAVLAGGPGDHKLAVKTLDLVMPHLPDLINGPYIAGTGVRKKLTDLHALVQVASTAQPPAEQSWKRVAAAAKAIRFRVTTLYEDSDSD